MFRKDALPTQPNLAENEIPDNDIDFTKELPNESEYYRTSTDRDDFVRPTLPEDDVNSEIDIEDGGIDLEDESKQTIASNCVFELSLIERLGRISHLDIKTRELTVQNNQQSNIALDDFLVIAQQQLLNDIKDIDARETINRIPSILRQIFVKTYGYDDNCAVSMVLHSDLNENQPNDSVEDDKEITFNVAEDTTTETGETVTDVATLNSNEAADGQTEDYQSRTLTFPTQSTNIQAIIDAYKALQNWKYSTQ